MEEHRNPCDPSFVGAPSRNGIDQDQKSSGGDSEFQPMAVPQILALSRDEAGADTH